MTIGVLHPAGDFARNAGALNAGAPGATTADVLRTLAENGWLGRGVDESLGGGGGTLWDAVEVVADVSAECMTAGFAFWCQRAFALYLAETENLFLRERVLPEVLAGRVAGATGLSNAMKHLCGIEGLRLSAENRGAAIEINGFLPWVSNLQRERFVVAIAAKTVQGSGVIAVPSDAEGLKRGDDLELIGLQASATATLTFEHAVVDRKWLISESAAAFLPKVRPAFILLQCGLSIGIARRSLEQAAKAARDLPGIFVERLEQFRREHRQLTQQARDLSVQAEWPVQRLRELFETRIAVTRLAVASAGLEQEICGGLSYLRHTDTARRLREAAFLPVLTPSLLQLETELARQAAASGDLCA